MGTSNENLYVNINQFQVATHLIVTAKCVALPQVTHDEDIIIKL